MTMEEKLFPILLRIQPDVIELTKEDYEQRMGIKPAGEEVKANPDVRQPVAEDPTPGTETPVRAGATEATRQEAIKELQTRGFGYKELRTKTRGQLIEML